MKSTKFLSVAVLVVGAIGFLLYWLMVKSDNQSYIDAMLNLTKILLLAGVALALIGWVKDIFSSKESLKRSIISLGFLFVVFLIAYLKADKHPYKLGNTEYSASVSTWADTGLWMFYILALIALGLMFFSWISDFFKSSE